MNTRTTYRFLFSLFSFFLLVCCASCSNDNEELDYITPLQGSESLFKEGLVFDENSSSQTISFESSQSWTASLVDAPVSWCTLSPSKGNAGRNTLVVSVSQNEGEDSRSAHLAIVAGSCSQELSVTQAAKGKQPVVVPDGLSFSPESPDADQPLTIQFKASRQSALYKHTGDVYVHIGVVSEGEWKFVPADWNVNLDKCKMKLVDENLWSLTLEPTIRQWFASGETPVNRLGIVIRSADGNKKGLDADSFVKVTDSRYQGFVPADIKEKSCPQGMEDGINYTPNGREATFVLYDSDTQGNHKDFAYIVGDFNDWQLSNTEASQMYRDNANHCWWITVGNLDPAKEYAFQYYLGMKSGETLRLADPYAHKILDPDNDRYIPESTYPAAQREYPKQGRGIVSVFTTAADTYQWKYSYQLKNPDDLLIYELHLRDFTASSDLNGAISKLDYLRSLNVNAIQLMPVQEFDGNDSWGYNPCFFFALDKAYGTPRRYKEFIDACHERGLAVLFDVVYNHATGNMPFAKLYWDASANKTAAVNPWFNVDAPHPYSVFHDFNHESPLVRTFVKRSLRYLLEEYHIDGFRFDLTKGFTQRQCTESNAANYDASRVKILTDYYNEITAVKPGAVMILEHFCCDQEEKELTRSGMKVWRNGNRAYCQSGMGYKDGSSFAPLYTATNGMPFGGYVGFMESHDEERTAFKAKSYGDGDLKTNLSSRMKSMATNAAFFFTIPGPKMIWQFGEMGYDVSIDEGGRTSRKPLHWEYLEDKDRNQLKEVYTRLMYIREKTPQLFAEKALERWNVTESDWTSCRTILLQSVDGKKLFVAGNFTSQQQEVSIAVPSGWNAYYNVILKEKSKYQGESKITLPAHSFIVLGNEIFD